MAIAVVQAQGATGAGPTLANAEDGAGIGFGLADSENAGATPVTKPTVTGTNYSWHKSVVLMVTSGGGASSFSDREVYMAAAATTGFYLFFKSGGAIGTYVQASGANKPADSTASNGAVPATWTAMTTSALPWDAGAEAAVNSTVNGDILMLLAGVGNNYAGSASAAAALPDLKLDYLETAS